MDVFACHSVIDAAVFEGIERSIYDFARTNAHNLIFNNTPVGVLREIKQRNDAGHMMISFVGEPISWVRRFMPAGQAVTKISKPGAAS